MVLAVSSGDQMQEEIPLVAPPSLGLAALSIWQSLLFGKPTAADPYHHIKTIKIAFVNALMS
jgi:hypothetical protein